MIRAQVTLVVGAASVSLVRLRAQAAYERPMAAVELDPLARNPVLVEAVRLSDSATIVMSFFRTFADVARGNDAAARAVGKTRSDLSAAADALQRTVEFRRAPADQGRAADSAGKAFGRPAADAGAAGDALARTVAYLRSHTDQTGATDDLNGALGADDDQNITFTKAISRTALAGDAATRASGKPVQDASAAGDLRTLLVAKAASDGSAAGDQALKAFGVGKTDAAAAGDTLARTVAYSRELLPRYAAGYFADPDYTEADVARAFDALSRAVQSQRSFSRTAGASDAFARALDLNRGPAEQASALDTLARVLSAARAPSDSAGASDANRTKAIGLSLPRGYANGYFASPDYAGQDIAHATDAAVESFGKAIARTARAQDTGILCVPTGYAAGYFALDYVNPVRTW